MSDFGDMVLLHLAISYGQINNFLAQICNSLIQSGSQAMTVFRCCRLLHDSIRLPNQLPRVNDDNELNGKVCLLCNQLLSKLVVGSLEKLGSKGIDTFSFRRKRNEFSP